MKLSAALLCTIGLGLLAGTAEAARVAGPYPTTRYPYGDYICYEEMTYVPNECQYESYYYDDYVGTYQWGRPAYCYYDYCPTGSIENGYCVSTGCYNTSAYLLGQGPGGISTGDIMFHFPPDDYTRNHAAIPSPLASAQASIFGPSTPSHTSSCSWGSVGRCLYQVHNDVDGAGLGTALMGTRIDLALSGGNLYADGLENLTPFTALVGTAQVGVLTTHLGEVEYYVTTSDLKVRLGNMSNWWFGTTRYKLGGVSHYISRSQCSETVAEIAGLDGSEGYRTMQFTGAGLSDKLPGVLDRVKADMLANTRIQNVRSALENMANYRASWIVGIFMDGIAIFVGNKSLVEIAKMVTRLGVGTGSLNIGAITNIFSLTKIDPNIINLTPTGFAQQFACDYRTWTNAFDTDRSMRCIGTKLLGAFDSMVTHLTYQAVNLMIDQPNVYWNSGAVAPLNVSDAFYTKFTATGDLRKRLGRAAQNNPCDPNNPSCSF
jgi:hypothetical protein